MLNNDAKTCKPGGIYLLQELNVMAFGHQKHSRIVSTGPHDLFNICWDLLRTDCDSNPVYNSS
jgi:hypothetical protein